MVLADDHLHIDAEIVFIAQDFRHPAARALRGRRPLDDFHLHHHVLQIVPVALAAGLPAQHAVRALPVRMLGRWGLAVFVTG